MAQIDKIRSAIRKVVTQQLAPARVLDVVVEEDEDFEGEAILRVAVVFDAAGDKLNPEKVLGLVRHLQGPLGKLNEDRFPVFSFSHPGELNGAAA